MIGWLVLAVVTFWVVFDVMTTDLGGDHDEDEDGAFCVFLDDDSDLAGSA